MRNVTVTINILIGAPPSVSDDQVADHVLDVFTSASDDLSDCEGVEVFIDDIEEIE